MTRTRQARLIEGPIAPTLIKLTLTMLVGIFSMIAFNLVDTFFLGRLGAAELAAISFTFPVVMAVGSIALGLGVGAAALVSRAIGTGDDEQVRRLATDSLALALIIVGAFVILGLLTIDPVFRLLGADETTLPLVRQYMLIWYPGMIFVVVPMVGNNAIRATGDTKTPSLIMLSAVLVNVVLDPILIFGLGPAPALGIQGAAIATVVARATTLVIALWVLYFRERMITLKAPPLRVALSSWGRLLYIGLPAAATNVILPLGLGIITAMTAVYGQEAVAGLGVASRVEGFALAMIMALSSVLGPFTGQNWGAGRLDRVRAGIRISQQFAIVWGVATFALLFLFARPVAGVFNDNPDVIGATVLYLTLVPVSYGLFGVLQLSNIALNTLNRPLHAGALMALRMFVIYVPLAYAGSRLFGIQGVFGAATVANMVAGLAAYLWLRRTLSGLSRAAPVAGVQRVAPGVSTVKPASN
jgi:putative MATE family efflux protein